MHSQAEERKREKENARVRRDKLQTLRDIEARAEAENLSSDAKPTAAEMAEAQSLREEVPGPFHVACIYFWVGAAAVALAEAAAVAPVPL